MKHQTWYVIAVFAWTCLSLGWTLFDLSLNLHAWTNFTSWVWSMQTVFFTLHSIHLINVNVVFITAATMDVYFLPILFACEWATALAVVYMIVENAGLFAANIEKFGEAETWIGSFIVHYITLIMLVLYMHQQPGRKKQLINTTLEKGEKAHFYHFWSLAVFAILFTYCTILTPATHYGLGQDSVKEINITLVICGLLGVAVFHAWLRNFEW